MEIRTGFKTYDGKIYPNLHNINFIDAKDLREHLGKFINETKIEPNSFFGGSQTDTIGVYIFKDLYDGKTGFRIYKDWSNNIFCNIEQHPQEAKMISEFTSRQPNIKLTSLPTSIVTLNNYVIGQKIILYSNSLTLLENIDKLNKEEIIKKYLEILKIFKELIRNGIIYSDVHAKNFMLVDNVIKLIDFDPNHISFDNSQYNKMIINLMTMLNQINEIKKINYQFKKETTIENIEESIMTKIKK